MEKKIIGNKSTPLSHLDHPVKQLLTTISKNLTLISLLFQQEIPSSFEIFCVPNLIFTLSNKFVPEEAQKTIF